MKKPILNRVNLVVFNEFISFFLKLCFIFKMSWMSNWKIKTTLKDNLKRFRFFEGSRQGLPRSCSFYKGPSIKYVHCKGEGVAQDKKRISIVFITSFCCLKARKREKLSKNHQIWAYVLCGWSSRWKRTLATEYVKVIFINFDRKKLQAKLSSPKSSAKALHMCCTRINSNYSFS